VSAIDYAFATDPLTVREVAAWLGIHPNTVKRIQPADLPYFTVGSRGDRRYRVEDVRSYIERRTIR
jgi:hypothetical protein